MFLRNSSLVSLISRAQAKANLFPSGSKTRTRLTEISSALLKGNDLSPGEMQVLLVTLAEVDSAALPKEPSAIEAMFLKTFGLTLFREEPELKPAPVPPTPVPARSVPSVPSPTPANAASRIGEAVLSVLTDEMESLSRRVAQTVTKEELADFALSVGETVREEFAKLPKPSASGLSISINQAPAVAIAGYTHPMFPVLLACAVNRINVMLVGPAGTGKTTMGKQVAQALGIQRVVAQSFCAQTPESRILGYLDAEGRYVRTQFRECYEHGGVYILDEMDSASPNVLTALNAAIDNGACTFPDATIHRHSDFIVIACANTYGNGADRQYVGRAQLDASTLNRFAKLTIDYDFDLDLRLAGQEAQPAVPYVMNPVSPADYAGIGKRWVNAIQAARSLVRDNGIRATISPRQTRDGYKLLCAGIQLTDVTKMLLTDGLSKLDADKINKAVQSEYRD